MTHSFISPVSETLLMLQKPDAENPQGRIRLDNFTYGFSKEGCYIAIDIEIYRTGERVNQIFRAKIIDGAKEQVMFILNQIK